MRRRVIASVFCAFVFGGSNIGASAGQSDRSFVDSIRKLFGWVPLGVDPDVIAVGLCNHTTTTLGVTVSFKPKVGIAHSAQYAIDPLGSGNCAPKPISKTWFGGALPASIGVSAFADGSHSVVQTTIVVRSGLNGVDFGVGDYCKKVYSPPPDEVNPSVNSPRFACLTLK